MSPEDLLSQAPTAEGKAIIAATALTTLGQRIKGDFINLAHWAYLVRRDALWAAQAESWEVFVDALGIETSAKRLSELGTIWEVLVVKEGLPPEAVVELGASKATYLLPCARRGELTADLLGQAQTAPNVRAVQEIVGRKIPEWEPREYSIQCPNCGWTIWGARRDNAKAGPRTDNPGGAGPTGESQIPPPSSATPSPAPPGGGERTTKERGGSDENHPLRWLQYQGQRATGTRDILRAVEDAKSQGIAPTRARLSPDLADAFTPWEIAKEIDQSLPRDTIILENEGV